MDFVLLFRDVMFNSSEVLIVTRLDWRENSFPADYAPFKKMLRGSSRGFSSRNGPTNALTSFFCFDGVVYPLVVQRWYGHRITSLVFSAEKRPP